MGCSESKDINRKQPVHQSEGKGETVKYGFEEIYKVCFFSV